MPVLHQHVAEITELGFLPMPFAVETGIRVRLRFMHIVAPPFPAELTWIVIAAIFLLEALLAGPSLDQRAVHGEMLVRKMGFGLHQYPAKEFAGDNLVEQPLPVLAE